MRLLLVLSFLLLAGVSAADEPDGSLSLSSDVNILIVGVPGNANQPEWLRPAASGFATVYQRTAMGADAAEGDPSQARQRNRFDIMVEISAPRSEAGAELAPSEFLVRIIHVPSGQTLESRRLSVDSTRARAGTPDEAVGSLFQQYAASLHPRP